MLVGFRVAFTILFVGASRPLLDATALISFALPICPHLDAFFGVALCSLPLLRPYPHFSSSVTPWAPSQPQAIQLNFGNLRN